MKTSILCFSAAILLSGCGSITVPARVTVEPGIVYSGTATASLQKGTFSVKNEAGVICSGEYDPLSQAKRIYSDFTCSNGRRGRASIVRDNNLKGGTGTVEFQDGSSGVIEFGEDRLG